MDDVVLQSPAVSIQHAVQKPKPEESGPPCLPTEIAKSVSDQETVIVRMIESDDHWATQFRAGPGTNENYLLLERNI